jgi:hypothetical protein
MISKNVGAFASVEDAWICFKGEANAPTGVYGAVSALVLHALILCVHLIFSFGQALILSFE